MDSLTLPHEKKFGHFRRLRNTKFEFVTIHFIATFKVTPTLKIFELEWPFRRMNAINDENKMWSGDGRPT